MATRSGVFFVLVLMLVGAFAAMTDDEYCTICKTHTMCIFKGVGKLCAPQLAAGVSDADKTAILKAHNDLRQKVAQGKETIGKPGPQPSASNMRLLTWDDELATLAQRWADQCNFEHDECNNVARFQVGQNMGWGAGSETSDWVFTVQDWYSEVKNYNKDWASAAVANEDTGHYTQTVWADTYLVGCGYVKYKNSQEKMVQHIYVCNYGPAGNYPGQPLYKGGDAAKQCPAGTASAENAGYPGLCA